LITLLASGDGIPRNARSGREFWKLWVEWHSIPSCLPGSWKMQPRRQSTWRLASSTIVNGISAYSKGRLFERFEIQISQLYEFVTKAMGSILIRGRNCMKDEFDGASFFRLFQASTVHVSCGYVTLSWLKKIIIQRDLRNLC
jgi:hypothetical protein